MAGKKGRADPIAGLVGGERLVRLVFQLLAGCFAERFKTRQRDKVGAPHPESLEACSVHAAFYPLVDGLAGHGWVDPLPGLFDAQVLLGVAIA